MGQSRRIFRHSPPANYCILPKGPFHLPPCQSCELVKCATRPSRWRARPCFLPFFRTFHFRPPVTFIVITSFVRITPYHYSISNSLHDFNPGSYRIFGRGFGCVLQANQCSLFEFYFRQLYNIINGIEGYYNINQHTGRAISNLKRFSVILVSYFIIFALSASCQ